MADLLTKRSWNVIPIVAPGTPLEDILLKRGLSPITIPSSNYIAPQTTFKLSRLFREHHVQAIHLHRSHDLGVVLPAAKMANVRKRVFTIQMESGRIKRDIYHRYVYSQLTNVLTITDRIKKKTIESVAVHPDKVQRLYYGIETEKFRAQMLPKSDIRKKWAIPENAFVVGMVGRLEAAKGQEVLIRAAAIAKDKIPSLKVILVGEETVGQSSELERLKILADELLPDRDVVFTGYQAPPGIIVPAFDLAVLATKRESFGLVILEAMALGVPMLATADGGVLEIIHDKMTGRLYQPGDHNALAQLIVELYSNPDERDRYATAALEMVRTKFSMEKHLSELESCFK
ncbi:glycosyltransferase [bacterium]|nr:glycosyltransferase [bacterium]